MRGVYEQQWQEALAGGRIEPSAAVWDNIAGSLDAERGRSGWVTILLIAATVTIAFAFPLTIGNSSFEARPDTQHYIGQQTIPQVPVDVKKQADQQVANKKPLPDLWPPATTRNVQAADKSATPKQQLGKHTEEFVPPAEVPAAWQYGSVYGFGIDDIDLGVIAPVSLDDYYLIPYYLPKNDTRRGLLAAANFGTGSLNNGGGLGGFGAMENADLAYSPANGGFSILADNRQENPGSTYYIGGGLVLPLGKRWSLSTGVGYLAQRATGTSNIVFDVGRGNQPLGAYDPMVTGAVILRESYAYSVVNNYLNVPVTFKYPIINKKMKFHAGVGISADFMLAHKVSAEGYGTSNYKPSSLGYNPVVLAGLFNLDVRYDIAEHYALAFETGWRKGLTAIDETQTYYPTSFTMGLMLFYQIR